MQSFAAKLDYKNPLLRLERSSGLGLNVCVYGGAQEPFNHKCVFDIGDLGLGVCANSLELGCDCLGHIKYFDGTINSPSGGELGTADAATCQPCILP